MKNYLKKKMGSEIKPEDIIMEANADVTSSNFVFGIKKLLEYVKENGIKVKKNTFNL